MPLWKRARFTTPTGRFEVGECSAAATARQLGLEDDMVGDMEETTPTMEDLSQKRGRVNMLFRDRRFHRHAVVLLNSKARHAREAWSHSMNCSKAVHVELYAYEAQTLEAREPELARDPEPQDGPADAGSSC
ncbi:hypothetical protein Tco_1054984 [Tanacetum coccineum]|uniref:Uncharacterized protein n=1 Tax=Tanacetum coccineum TaxID=301880 RepID=A0ABQ5GYB9_9ASTR